MTNCSRCGDSLDRHPYDPYRVTSDIIDMIVCFYCARDALRLTKYHGDGEMNVERITLDS